MLDREPRIGDVLYDNRFPPTQYGPHVVAEIKNGHIKYQGGAGDRVRDVIELYDFYPLNHKETEFLIYN